MSTSSPFLYVKMEAEPEVAMKVVGFKYKVIIKPGMLVGDRSPGLQNLFLGGLPKAWVG